jgi:hypothetical protein
MWGRHEIVAEAKLQRAKTLIESRQYEEARAILRTLPDNPTAQRWLTKLDQMSPTTANTEHEALLKQAKTLINDKKWAEARALLTPIQSNPTAQRWLAKLDELAPASASPTPAIKAISEAPKPPKVKAGASAAGKGLTWPILAGVGVVAAVLVIGIGAVAMSASKTPAPSTPAGTAQEFIKALVVEQDQTHLLALTCDSSKSNISLFSSMVSSSLQRNNVTNVDISGLTYTVTSQTATTALVDVGGSMHYTMQGTPQDETFAHFSGNDSGIALLLENGQWHYCLEAANSIEATVAATQPANPIASETALPDGVSDYDMTLAEQARQEQTSQNAAQSNIEASRTAVAATSAPLFATRTANAVGSQGAPAGTEIPSFHVTLTNEVGNSLTLQADKVNSIAATYTAIAVESEIIYMTLTAQAKSR